MTSSRPPHSPAKDPYAAIESALLDSPRGRWFLAEFARRNRSADTRVLLDAIGKLQDAVAPAAVQDSERMRRDIIEMSEAIAQTRREIAAIKAPGGQESQITTAAGQLDAIVEATERATGDILSAAETLQELSMELREKGLKTAYCERLDTLATDVFTACSFQDITGQRTTKVVQVLQFLENRVNAMIAIWGIDEIAFREASLPPEVNIESALLNGPQADGVALRQDDIDSMLIDFAAPADEVSAAAAEDIVFADEPAAGNVLFDAPTVAEPDPARAEDKPEAAEATSHATAMAAAGARFTGVDEDLFDQAEDLSLWSLDATKKNALFG